MSNLTHVRVIPCSLRAREPSVNNYERNIIVVEECINKRIQCKQFNYGRKSQNLQI